MHRNERHVQRQRGRLSKVHTHEQRADQAGRIGHGHSVNLAARHARLLERLLGKAGNCLNVLARGNFRHHAAVDAVQRHL